MLQANFDDLEFSLSVTLERVKRDQLLKKASLAKKTAQYDHKLMAQLEEQAQLLNLIKDHYRELKALQEWLELEKQSVALLTHHTLFSQEKEKEYRAFERALREKILSIRGEVDEERNERIISRGMEHAQRSTRVKTFKHWTRV